MSVPAVASVVSAPVPVMAPLNVVLSADNVRVEAPVVVKVWTV